MYRRLKRSAFTIPVERAHNSRQRAAAVPFRLVRFVPRVVLRIVICERLVRGVYTRYQPGSASAKKEGREGGRERQAVKGERSGVRDTVFIEGRRSATHSLHASTVVALRFSVVRCESRRASSFESLARAALDILLRGRPRSEWQVSLTYYSRSIRQFLKLRSRATQWQPYKCHRQTRSVTP